jgi:flagellar hook protein FlgE
MTFRLALSGLNAASTDLNVTANNIANTATTGFKSARTQFADVFAVSPQGVSSTASGNGVRVASVAQQFTQGNIDYTDNSLDLAISGQGFFVVSSEGGLSYTRAGAFQVDPDGYVINSEQQRLQVYPPTATGFNTGTFADLRLSTGESAPAATSNAEIAANLPANSTVPATATFDPADPTSYNNATSMTVYDSLGAAHSATLYFVKDAAANTWQQNLYIDGNAVGTAQTLVFSDTGALSTPANGDITFPAYTPATGAADINLTLDYSRTTQYGGAFGVSAITQDGYTTGRLIGMNISSDGIVQARYTNGRSLALGQVALANFSNPQGLQQLGNTSWAETFNSGQAVPGIPGGSGLGLLQSGALEASNVDITEQLVNMITAQRNFQANAQMISTADQVTQTIINIR